MSAASLDLLILVGLSIVVALVIVVPIILWRILNKKPILFDPSTNKKTPQVVVLGISLFGLFAVICFLSGMLYLGIAFLLLFIASLLGYICYKKKTC